MIGSNWRDGLPLLVTSRVVLRELRRADAPALLRLARSPAVAPYAVQIPATLDECEAFVARGWRDRATGRYAGYAAVPSGATEPAGVLELHSTQPAFYRAELRLWLEAGLWAPEPFADAMALLCGFAFRTVGVRRMEIRSAAAHHACTTALEALGVVREATLRHALIGLGAPADQHLWSIVRGLDRLAASA